jgi:uncharacterized protein YhfF
VVKRFSFWVDLPEIDEFLVAQVMGGSKTGTARPKSSWGVPLHQWDSAEFEVGEVAEFYDFSHNKRARIKFTDVYEFSFGEIPEKLWRAEVCTSAKHFQDDHRTGWPDLELTPNFALMAIHFDIVAKES